MKSRSRVRPAPGPGLIHQLERTLGIGVLIGSVDPEPPFTIDALLIAGRHSQEVTASGISEAAAWQHLAEIAVAWRNANDKQFEFWPGGGGGV